MRRMTVDRGGLTSVTHNSPRCTNIQLVLYPDCDEHMYLLHKIKNLYDYALSPLHNKDVWTAEDEQDNPEHKAGTTKKAHYHCIIMLGNQVTLPKISKELGIKENQIEVVHSLRSMIRYLCHLDSADKYHYNPTEIETNKENRVLIALKSNLVQFEEEAIIEILDVLENEKEWSYTDCIRYFCYCGLYGYFRRMGINARIVYIENHQDRKINKSMGGDIYDS